MQNKHEHSLRSVIFHRRGLIDSLRKPNAKKEETEMVKKTHTEICKELIDHMSQVNFLAADGNEVDYKFF